MAKKVKKGKSLMTEQQLFIKAMKSTNIFFLMENVLGGSTLDENTLNFMLQYVVNTEYINDYRQFDKEVTHRIIENITKLIKELYVFVQENKDEHILTKMKNGENIIKNRLKNELSDEVSIEMVAFVFGMIHKTLYVDVFKKMSLYNKYDDDMTEIKYKYISAGVNQAYNMIGNYIFVSKEKPKNFIIKNIIIKDDGKIIYDYSGTKILISDDVSIYNNTGDFYAILDSFISRCQNDWYQDYLLILSNLAETLERNNLENGAWSITDSSLIDMPFFMVKTDTPESIAIMYKYNELTKEIMSWKKEKKYAIPKEGCILKFIDNETYIESVLINNTEDEYIFEVTFNEYWFEADEDGKRRGTFYLSKVDAEEIIDSLNNMGDMNTLLGSKSIFSVSERSTKLEDVGNREKSIALSFNLFFIFCLYIVYNKLEYEECYIMNIYSQNAGNRRYIKRFLRYKTAILEKESKDFEYVKDDDEGSNLKSKTQERFLQKYSAENGYKFVEEYEHVIKQNLNKFINI